MDKKICKGCDAYYCSMFFGHEKDGRKYVRVYCRTNDEPNLTLKKLLEQRCVEMNEMYMADATVVRETDGRIRCSRAMYEKWTYKFPWQYDDVVPDDTGTCLRYAEHLVSMLNKRKRK